MPTSLAILNVQLIFDSYFASTCFGSSSIFAYSKKCIKEFVSNFQGGTVNKEYYLQVMRNLREAIRQKRPDLWKNKNWLSHHDNAPAHTSLPMREVLAKNNIITLPQPSYSPDLVPPKLKRQKSKTSQNLSKQNSCQKLTEHSKWPNLLAEVPT